MHATSIWFNYCFRISGGFIYRGVFNQLCSGTWLELTSSNLGSVRIIWMWITV